MARLNELDWQILFYLGFSALIITGFWVVFFIKTKIITKLVYLVLFIIYFQLPQLFPSVTKQFDKDYCLDTGKCAEGLELNTEHGLIKINKENCLKYGWVWDEDKKWCNVND